MFVFGLVVIRVCGHLILQVQKCYETAMVFQTGHMYKMYYKDLCRLSVSLAMMLVVYGGLFL